LAYLRFPIDVGRTPNSEDSCLQHCLPPQKKSAPHKKVHKMLGWTW